MDKCSEARQRREQGPGGLMNGWTLLLHPPVACGTAPSSTASAHIGPVDFGPVEVVVNGVRYVREETLFAAMRELDELREANERRDSQMKRAE